MTARLGITVMPEWIQAEGADRLLDTLLRSGATAIATSPYVMAPSDAPDAGREPPIDAGSGKVRLLDRELWGRRELRCVTSPSFTPDPSLYRGLAYQPSAPNDLGMAEGPKIAAFLEKAKAAGLEVQLQIQAAIPPGYRVQFGGALPEDRPHLPTGAPHEGRIDKNGSLASPRIVDYGCALLRDLAIAYPMVDAIRVDWPEYPPYSFLSWFFDFGDPAREAARRKGYDIEAMRADCLALMAEPSLFLDEGLLARDGFSSLQRFKADLACDLLRAFRDALPTSIQLVAHAFPEPWCRLSGMDMARIGEIADEIAVKLYTMHWPVMLADYEKAMGGPAPEIARRLQRLFETGSEVTDLRYPEPHEAHPAGLEAQRRKIEQARASGARIVPVAHGYGPREDVLARVRAAFEAGDNQVWINRYGYLSDAKLDDLGRLMAAVR